MILCQGKEINPSSCKDAKKLLLWQTGSYCTFCNNAKNKEEDNANNPKEAYDYTFATQHEAYLETMYTRITDYTTTKHMTFYKGI